MKRKYIIRKLAEAGFEFEEGANHTKVRKDGRIVSIVARHTEINEMTVKQIEEQTGIRLK